MRGIFIILFSEALSQCQKIHLSKNSQFQVYGGCVWWNIWNYWRQRQKGTFGHTFLTMHLILYGNGIRPIPFPSRKSHFQLWFKASCSAYIQLTMIDSPILKKITSNILPTLKQHLEAQLPPPAGNYIRSEMLDIIFSGKYPTSR